MSQFLTEMFSITAGSSLWRNNQQDGLSFEQPENPHEGNTAIISLQVNVLIGTPRS